MSHAAPADATANSGRPAPPFDRGCGHHDARPFDPACCMMAADKSFRSINGP